NTLFMLVICYQNSGFGFAVKITPTGYFFQNCHDFLVGVGVDSCVVVGSLDSINSMAFFKLSI
ncbi:hypothetical protein CGH90_25635, partial [Vibrio parahaemolyticus]